MSGKAMRSDEIDDEEGLVKDDDFSLESILGEGTPGDDDADLEELETDEEEFEDDDFDDEDYDDDQDIEREDRDNDDEDDDDFVPTNCYGPYQGN